jgi:UDP-N-acetylglucosamine 2-epimerase
VLRRHHHEILLHTGQHYDDEMSDRFFRELSIPRPDIALGVGSGLHGEQTAKMLVGIEAAITEQRPDAVMVYGDTNSTLAGALAASKLQVPVAHVEAGLRSFNRAMPEELNRMVADTLSTLLLCPSEGAVANLAREGITRGVHCVGDVMWELLNRVAANGPPSPAARLGMANGAYVVATVHRAENTDDPARLNAILQALNELPWPVLFPVHPRIATTVAAKRRSSRVHFVAPLGYADMIAAVRDAHAAVTDSGGLQKEAYWLGVPCVTLREETEWVETVAAGWNTLAGADPARITAAVSGAARPASRPPLYGDGHAAERIIEAFNTWN